MSARVCIVGVGVVESEKPIVELSHKEILFQATRKALNDAGLERKDIRGAVTASFDFLEGRSLSNQYILDSVGGVMKPCDLRLGEDAIYSLFAGYLEVRSDPSQVVVVASVQKASEREPEGFPYQELIADSMEPVFSRPVCKSVPNLASLEPVLAAMEARAFMHRSGLTEDHFAAVAVKNINNAAFAGQKDPIDLKKVLGSETLSWPIKAMTRAEQRDAACALILASGKRGKKLASEPVFIRGIGWCSGRSHLPSRKQGIAQETNWAAQQAYDMAGILKPEQQIDLAEISDWYAHRELMHYEALGFCGFHDMGQKIEDGFFEKKGPFPVNVTGGLLGRGNSVGTSGLIRVAQVAQQIRGNAEGYKVPDVRVGLAHSWGGIPTASAGVAILSRW
ncbi:MAG: hypothetical protein PVI20_02320 [Desulfobacteraceae bacterium]|jgi:acetyl-CoA C-acetyltransferase